MAYSKEVLDHYNNPQNVGSLPKDDDDVGTGLVGAPECGDVMKLQIKVEDDKIVDAKFKTFGCGSAIASSSLATEWVKGKTVDEALEIKNTNIVEELSTISELIELKMSSLHEKKNLPAILNTLTYFIVLFLLGYVSYLSWGTWYSIPAFLIYGTFY